MSKTSLEEFNPDAIKTFVDVCKRNTNIFISNKYKHSTDVILYQENTQEIIKHSELVGKVDLIITSPPYGDSHTTVAYGQFSRLANEWLEFKDAGSLDKKLLGGKKTKDIVFNIEELDDAIAQIKQNNK